MMTGRKGDIPEATRLFNTYYQNQLTKYEQALETGTKTYLKKGERITYRNTRTNTTETITAAKDGYVTLYNASKKHLIYLEELAQDLGIVLYPHPLL